VCYSPFSVPRVRLAAHEDIGNNFASSFVKNIQQVQRKLNIMIVPGQKTAEIDILPLSQNALKVLKKRRRNRLSGFDRVFPNQNGSRIIERNLFPVFDAALNSAEIEKFRIHLKSRLAQFSKKEGAQSPLRVATP